MEYPFTHPTLGVTIHVSVYDDGSSQIYKEYHLTPEERNALPWPDNENTWKANKAAELGMTLEDYEAAVAREVIQAPFSCKGMKMEANRNRLIGEFRAYNGGLIARGEATVEEVRAFRKSPEAAEILDSLRALDFDDAINLIQAWEHPLATDEFKAYWTAKIQGAM